MFGPKAIVAFLDSRSSYEQTQRTLLTRRVKHVPYEQTQRSLLTRRAKHVLKLKPVFEEWAHTVRSVPRLLTLRLSFEQWQWLRLQNLQRIFRSWSTQTKILRIQRLQEWNTCKRVLFIWLYQTHLQQGLLHIVEQQRLRDTVEELV